MRAMVSNANEAMLSLLETATPAPPSTIPPTTAMPGRSPPIPPAPATATPATAMPATATTPTTNAPTTAVIGGGSTVPATATTPTTNAPTTAVIGGGSTAVIGGGSADNPIDVDKQPLRKNAFESTKADRALEWSAILLEQHKPEKGGKEKTKPSKVYDHFYLVFLNSEVVSYTYFFTCEFLVLSPLLLTNYSCLFKMDDNPGLSAQPGISVIMSKPDLPTWVCMICKAAGKPLVSCMRQYELGNTSNMSKHLGKFVDHIKVVEEAEKKKAEQVVSLF
jgi:hypothetical protein